MSFNYESLHVYQRVLSFNARVAVLVKEWAIKHAIRDQLNRAASSVLENLAVACAKSDGGKLRALDFAIGSTLECAACFDLSAIKRLMQPKPALDEKTDLAEIAKMLIGLRRSWAKSHTCVKEEQEPYGASCLKQPVMFHHEELRVYQFTLEFAETFYESSQVCSLPISVFRRFDELITTVALNIAEGNGRFSIDDQKRFISTSHEATIKIAARLDLCGRQDLLDSSEVNVLKGILEQVAALTGSMVRKN